MSIRRLCMGLLLVSGLLAVPSLAVAQPAGAQPTLSLASGHHDQPAFVDAVVQNPSAPPLSVGAASAFVASAATQAEPGPCNYDYRSHFPRPPPSDTVSYGYDTVAELVDLVADGSRVLRVSLGSESDRVALSRVPVCLRSFSDDTEVLLGDGITTKPISELEVGEEVWATDPETGESGPQRVEAVWPHYDWLLEFEVEGGSVTTTEDHHFWNATDRDWQETQHLDTGDLLLTPSGDGIAAGSLDWSTWQYDEAYDLTIEGIHSYYVEAGDQDVLVHNCGPLGSGGTQTTSKTLLKPRGRNFRIDVENPAPGVRAGQLHLQSGSQKYLYDFSANQFIGLPRPLARQIANDPSVAAAIAKGRTYLNVQP